MRSVAASPSIHLLTLWIVCGIANAQTSVVLTSTTLEAGTQGSISLRLEGIDSSWSGMNARVTLPPEFDFLGVNVPGTFSSFVFDSHAIPGTDDIGIVLYSPVQGFGATSTTAVLIDLFVPPGTASGGYPTTFKMNSTGISDQDGSTSFVHSTVAGTVTVVEASALPLGRLVAGLLPLILAIWSIRLVRAPHRPRSRAPF